MSLTADQELEMYSDIKVIKRILEDNELVKNNHEKRISNLERAYWAFIGICSVITFILPFIIQYFLLK